MSGAVLTTKQKEIFQSRGLIRLERFLPADTVACAREAVRGHLQRAGLWRDGHWQLGELSPETGPKTSANLRKGLKRRREITDLVAEGVREVVTELLDGDVASPITDCPQILFTLPNATRWTVPHNIWHLDLPRLPESGIPGVQVFAFLATVAPGGGGTLVVAGSHRLLNEGKHISSRQLKKRLKREGYFRDLMSKHFVDRDRFVREPGRVGDVELQVVELHGEPGDAFFMDLRILHTLAPNARRVPRIMLTQRFLRDSLRGTAYGAELSP